MEYQISINFKRFQFSNQRFYKYLSADIQITTSFKKPQHWLLANVNSLTLFHSTTESIPQFLLAPKILLPQKKNHCSQTPCYLFHLIEAPLHLISAVIISLMSGSVSSSPRSFSPSPLHDYKAYLHHKLGDSKVSTYSIELGDPTEATSADTVLTTGENVSQI